MKIAAGSRLGPFEVTAKLGEGGMGEVYRARHSRLGREVAVKVLPAERAEDPDFLRRFEQEARAIASLSHPDICTPFDVGHDGNVHYLVMELLSLATSNVPPDSTRSCAAASSATAPIVMHPPRRSSRRSQRWAPARRRRRLR